MSGVDVEFVETDIFNKDALDAEFKAKFPKLLVSWSHSWCTPFCGFATSSVVAVLDHAKILAMMLTAAAMPKHAYTHRHDANALYVHCRSPPLSTAMLDLPRHWPFHTTLPAKALASRTCSTSLALLPLRRLRSSSGRPSPMRTSSLLSLRGTFPLSEAHTTRNPRTMARLPLPSSSSTSTSILSHALSSSPSASPLPISCLVPPFSAVETTCVVALCTQSASRD